MLANVRKAITALGCEGGTAKEKHIAKEFSDKLSSRLTAVLVGPLDPSALERLSSTLLVDIQPLYASRPKLALAVTAEIVGDIYSTRLGPCLEATRKNGSAPKEQAHWETLLDGAIIEGLQEYVESDSYDPKPFGDALYRTLCRMLTSSTSEHIGIHLRAQIASLLSDSIHKQAYNRALLLDREILGCNQLGELVASCHSYLLLEPLFELMGRLMPAPRDTKSRVAFMRGVFGCQKARDVLGAEVGTRLGKILSKADASNWDETAQDLFQALADEDSQRPQPFQISELNVRGVAYTTPLPLYVDEESFVVHVQDAEDGTLSLMELPYASLRTLATFSAQKDRTHISCASTGPPLLHMRPMFEKEEAPTKLITFDISSGDVTKFKSTLAARNMAKKLIDQTPKKISEVSPVPVSENWQVGQGADQRKRRLEMSEMVESSSPDKVAEAPALVEKDERDQNDMAKSSLSALQHGPSQQGSLHVSGSGSLASRHLVAHNPAKSDTAAAKAVKTPTPRSAPDALHKAIFGDDLDDDLTEDDSPITQKPQAKAKLDTTKSTYGRKPQAKKRTTRAVVYDESDDMEEPVTNVLEDAEEDFFVVARSRPGNDANTGGKAPHTRKGLVTAARADGVVAESPKSRARLPRAAKAKAADVHGPAATAAPTLKRKFKEPDISGAKETGDLDSDASEAMPPSKKAKLKKENGAPPVKASTEPIKARSVKPKPARTLPSPGLNGSSDLKVQDDTEHLPDAQKSEPSANGSRGRSTRQVNNSSGSPTKAKDVDNWITADALLHPAESIGTRRAIDGYSTSSAARPDHNHKTPILRTFVTERTVVEERHEFDMDVDLDVFGGPDLQAERDAQSAQQAAFNAFSASPSPLRKDVQNNQFAFPVVKPLLSPPVPPVINTAQRSESHKKPDEKKQLIKTDVPKPIPHRKLSKAPWESKDFFNIVRESNNQEVVGKEPSDNAIRGHDIADAAVHEVQVKKGSVSAAGEVTYDIPLKLGRLNGPLASFNEQIVADPDLEFDFEFEELDQSEPARLPPPPKKAPVVDLTEDSDMEKSAWPADPFKAPSPLPDSARQANKSVHFVQDPIQSTPVEREEPTRHTARRDIDSAKASKVNAAKLKLDAMRDKRDKAAHDKANRTPLEGVVRSAPIRDEDPDEDVAEQRRRPEEVPPVNAIIEALDAIRDVLVSNLNNKVAYVKSNVRTARAKIMAEAQADLAVLYQQKLRQYDEFVQLHELYSQHSRSLQEAYGDLRRTNQSITSALQKTIRRHDKISLASKLPPTLFARPSGNTD